MYQVYKARYLYPGMFFPEEVTYALTEPTLKVAIKAGPDEGGYFKKNGWYAVHITTYNKKVFTADDGEQTSTMSVVKNESWIVGNKVHYSDIDQTDANRILISNIRSNSKDGYGVLTRAGNWQIANDYNHVISDF